MDQTNLLSLSAFLVALAQIPDSESIPVTDSRIVQEPSLTIGNLREQGGCQQFWQIYEQSRRDLVKQYQTKVRSKTIFPSQTPEDASPEANNEEENLSLSAEGIEASWQQLDEIFTGRPDQNVKQSYEEYCQNNPNTANKDHYYWVTHFLSSKGFL